VGPSPGEAGSNLLKPDRRRRLTKSSSLHKKRSSLRGRTKVAKAGPLRARVKSAKVRPTPYVYYPRVNILNTVTKIAPNYSCGCAAFLCVSTIPCHDSYDFVRLDYQVPLPALASIIVIVIPPHNAQLHYPLRSAAPIYRVACARGPGRPAGPTRCGIKTARAVFTPIVLHPRAQ